jgi:Fe-S-cluster-containing dehydrogenase component
VQTFEVGEFPNTETVHFPKSCLHCEEPPCVPVCPTGASYKRKEDGIVLVDYDKCIGCKYCSWACPYGAREIDEKQKVMKKCTLCVDRIYDTTCRSATASRLRQGLPDQRAPVRRRARSGIRKCRRPSARAAAIR